MLHKLCNVTDFLEVVQAWTNSPKLKILYQKIGRFLYNAEFCLLTVMIACCQLWLPGPPVRNGPVRSVVRIFLVRDFLVRSVVRIFWFGFFGPDFFGPVRGPDFSVRIFLVRSVVRIYRSGFFWSGPCPDFWSG